MDEGVLAAYGWNDRWEGLLHAHPPEAEPARVVRHDGAGLLVATAEEGIIAVPLVERVVPAPAVGDWVTLVAGRPATVLDRTSLLRRRDDRTDTQQVLAANVDLVLLVCGLDRPVKDGRIQRGAALAREAGATPAVVLTKAAKAELVDAIDPEAVAAELRETHPGLEVVVTSAKEGVGLAALEALVKDNTVVLLGESGAGKSSIVNALLGDERAAIGRVRTGDSKGRHTTTSRELYVLPRGGILIDTPGIRAIGLWTDPESTAVAETFADIDELSEMCRFSNCGHDTEPGCTVMAAVRDGSLTAARLDAWRLLQHEAEAAELRASPHERRRYDKKFARITTDAQKRKDRR